MNKDRQLSLVFVAARGDTTHLTFGSLDDSLFTRFDPATFDPAAVEIAASSAHMSRDAHVENIDIQLQQIAFDNGPILVSEPSPLALWMAGLLVFGALTSRTAKRRETMPAP